MFATRYRNPFQPSISTNGEYIVFNSDASNLVAGDSNSFGDVFVHDRISGETRRISVDSNGMEANEYSGNPSISADGRYVAFISGASSLVPDLNYQYQQVFLHDLDTSTTELISINHLGQPTEGLLCNAPSVSANGRYIAFESINDDLVADDSNGGWDVLIRDRLTQTNRRVSLTDLGGEANSDTYPNTLIQIYPSITADGRTVAFTSKASNLVPGDDNELSDIFVRSRDTMFSDSFE